MGVNSQPTQLHANPLIIAKTFPATRSSLLMHSNLSCIIILQLKKLLEGFQNNRSINTKSS